MLNILIAEDDFISRKFLFKVLAQYGECDLVVDGLEAIDAYMMAKDENNPYDLICLDIMIPKIDGVKVLKTIRDLERKNELSNAQGSKIIMTTAVTDTEVMNQAMELGCDAYLTKPIDVSQLADIMKKLQLID